MCFDHYPLVQSASHSEMKREHCATEDLAKFSLNSLHSGWYLGVHFPKFLQISKSQYSSQLLLNCLNSSLHIMQSFTFSAHRTDYEERLCCFLPNPNSAFLGSYNLEQVIEPFSAPISSSVKRNEQPYKPGSCCKNLLVKLLQDSKCSVNINLYYSLSSLQQIHLKGHGPFFSSLPRFSPFIQPAPPGGLATHERAYA